VLLLSGAITRTLADDEIREAAERVGSVIGGMIASVLIVLAVRFVYVKLFAKDAAVWSPWVLVVAGTLEWLAAFGAAGEG
jgi:hypothetical protein